MRTQCRDCYQVFYLGYDEYCDSLGDDGAREDDCEGEEVGEDHHQLLKPTEPGSILGRAGVKLAGTGLQRKMKYSKISIVGLKIGGLKICVPKLSTAKYIK